MSTWIKFDGKLATIFSYSLDRKRVCITGIGWVDVNDERIDWWVNQKNPS